METIYGIQRDVIDIDTLTKMNNNQRQKFVEENKKLIGTKHYPIKEWFYYLNSNMIDTEFHLWFIVETN